MKSMYLFFLSHYNNILWKTFLFISAFFFNLAIHPSFINTVAAACDPATQICNPIQADTFLELVEAIASAVTAIGIPLVAIFLVWSGFLFVTARGNEEQLKKAKTTLSWTLIGGAVLIGARVLAIAIVNFAKGLG